MSTVQYAIPPPFNVNQEFPSSSNELYADLAIDYNYRHTSCALPAFVLSLAFVPLGAAIGALQQRCLNLKSSNVGPSEFSCEAEAQEKSSITARWISKLLLGCVLISWIQAHRYALGYSRCCETKDLRVPGGHPRQILQQYVKDPGRSSL